MKTRLFFAVLGWLFYVACKGAYKGYFSSDDLDNLAWTRFAHYDAFVEGLFTPRFYTTNFRPVGHFFFWCMGRWADLQYPPYMAVVHGLHFLNTILLWRLCGKFELPWLARAAGTVLFAFHMAAFDAYWKPMYVFDVLCAAFALASILCWTGGHRWWSLGLFFLSYKSKELAVAVPLVLALYEQWFGQKRFRALIPHGAVAALFAGQALLMQSGQAGDYGIRLTPATLWTAVQFYGAALGPVALLPLLHWKDKRVWFGMAALLLFLGPMFAVPGRLFSAYLYLPLAGLGIAFAAVVDRWRWVTAALLLWLPLQYFALRDRRNVALAEADETRIYVGKVRGVAREMPDIEQILIDGYPASMRRWGVEGALRLAFDRDKVNATFVEDTRRPEPDAAKTLAVLSWSASQRDLLALRRTAGNDAAYIELGRLTPFWLLTEGWFQGEDRFRWIAPVAKAKLRKPAGGTRFSVTVNVSPQYIAAVKRSTLTVLVNGVEIGKPVYTENGWLTDYFAVPPAAKDEMVDVEFRVEPPFRPTNGDPRTLGVPIAAFGFR
ncbi:MAG: hypothetical protein FJW30_02230 [Acidobacteria bacterium]|nr:hypothetical protein [Acidobacteriota bacterium]